jgi:6-phosphofructokinase 1
MSKKVKRRIAVLTGGGDTSALNAILKGIALGAEKHNGELIGIIEGWAGLLKGGQQAELKASQIDENCGGTLIKTSRTNLLEIEGGVDEALSNLRKLRISALIAIGGDDTLSVGAKISQFMPVALVTKTIDNDVGKNAPKGKKIDYSKIVNYFCPGFPTASNRMAQFTSDLRTTAYSHNRVIVIEAMGRDMGWLALASAYGKPDFIIVPEIGLNYEMLKDKVAKRYIGQKNVVIAIAEGAKYKDGALIASDPSYLDAFGHAKPGGCSEVIAKKLKSDLAKELKTSNFNHVIPSYLLRSGSPIELDKNFALKLGQLAIESVIAESQKQVACVIRSGEKLEPRLLDIEDVLGFDGSGNVIPRGLDLRFYNPEDYQITEAGTEYFKPIMYSQLANSQ